MKSRGGEISADIRVLEVSAVLISLWFLSCKATREGCSVFTSRQHGCWFERVLLRCRCKSRRRQTMISNSLQFSKKWRQTVGET